MLCAIVPASEIQSAPLNAAALPVAAEQTPGVVPMSDKLKSQLLFIPAQKLRYIGTGDRNSGKLQKNNSPKYQKCTNPTGRSGQYLYFAIRPHIA